MTVTIMAVDLILKFRLSAIEHAQVRPQSWQLELMTIEELASVLISLGFIDVETAQRLSHASTTVTPQSGITTVPLRDLAALRAYMSPDAEPLSPETQEGYMLVVRGETTEEELMAAGFVAAGLGRLQ